MVYKYQLETIKYLKELSEKLERITEAKMTLKIGYIRGEFLNPWGTGYYNDDGNLYLHINYDDCFSAITEIERVYFSEPDPDMYIKFDSDIFLKLNEWIDKIYSNKREREAFHDKLNKELKALNLSL